MTGSGEQAEALAEQIAREAHAGQMYDDRSYVDGHLQPAVNLVRALGYGPFYRATTWLHDVFEDPGWVTPDYVRERGVPDEVVEGAVLTTWLSGQSLQDYRRQLLRSPYAIVAKLGDSGVNGANTLLLQPEVPWDVLVRRLDKYIGNLAFLAQHLPPPDELEDRGIDNAHAPLQGLVVQLLGRQAAA